MIEKMSAMRPHPQQVSSRFALRAPWSIGASCMRRKTPGIATWLVALFCIYVASIGPMRWLSWHGYISPWTNVALYLPVLQAADASDTLRHLLTWYADLFVR